MSTSHQMVKGKGNNVLYVDALRLERVASRSIRWTTVSHNELVWTESSVHREGDGGGFRSPTRCLFEGSLISSTTHGGQDFLPCQICEASCCYEGTRSHTLPQILPKP